MKRHFIAKQLAPERADEAFPIARAAVPGLTLERWRVFTGDAVTVGDRASAPGIMVVENERGYIQGLCTYRLQHDMRHGTILAVDDLVVLDLVDNGAVAAALVDALEAWARAVGCSAIRLHVAEDAEARPNSPVLYEFLKRNGHAVDAVRLVKPVVIPVR
jgi:GNAT superfamily N-acetyltransferase